MKSAQLLLADDNELSMKLMKVIFEGEGYITFSARDGAEAMTILLQEKIDLIVTDILMPNVDGYYLCYKVRLHEQLKSIPIIVYSGTFTSQSEEKVAKEMGANLFIRKPAPKDVLVGAVRDLLSNPESNNPTVSVSAESFEVMHQYSASLIAKLEHRNILLEEAKQNLERTVDERTQELKYTVEELQATNEEFEAANEELQAANEELATLNDQLSVASDVIEKQTQLILSQRDEQLNRIFDTVTDVIFVLDVEKEGGYKIASVNKVYETVRGKSAREIIGKRLEETTDKSTFENLDEKCKAVIADKKIVRWEVTTDMPTGKRTGEFSMAPVLDKEGNCIQLVGAIHDITERKNNEDEIRKLNASLTDFQQAIYQSAIVSRADNRGVITYANENFVKISGYQFKELIGQNHRIINSGFHPKAFWVNMWKTISSGKIWREDVKNKAKDGSDYWVDTFIMPFADSQGQVTEYISIRNDITKRKQAEGRIEKSEKRFRALIENNNDLISVCDQSLKFIYRSPSAVRITGWTEDDIRNFDGTTHIHPDDKEKVEVAIAESFKNPNKPITYLYRYRHKNGHYIWLENTATNLLNEDSVRGILFNSRDVTKQRESEEKIKESEERYRSIYENTGEAILLTKTDGTILSANAVACKIFGRTEEEICRLGRDGIVNIHDPRLPIAQQERIRAGKMQGELTLVRKDGSFFAGEISAVGFINKDGEERTSVIIRDISERKEAERILKEYIERFEIVSKATNDAIWDWSINQDIMIWNHGVQTIFGYTEREIKATGDWWKKKIHPDDFERINQELDEAFKKKVNNWVSQYQYKCANGSFKHVLDRAYIIYEDDKPFRIIGAMQDITEVVEFRLGLERMVEERTHKLNEALKKEKELVEMKSKFISIASHEFRTPLTTIALTTGFIKKYKSKLQSDDLDKKLVDIEKQVSHMTYLLDDVLMIGKAEAGKIQVHLKKINLDFFETLAREVVKSSGAGHKLQYKNKCETKSIMTDEKLMRNIIINLLTNAIKFSPGKKEVLMNISCNKKSIFITVKDAGIGIPSWDVKNLFTSFSRGSNVGAIEGTGLGLSIVKKAVDMLNGTIQVKSKVKQGTEFTIALPLLHA